MLVLQDKNSLYILPDVLTTVTQKYPLFLFRAIFLTDLDRYGFTKLFQGQFLREGHQSLPFEGDETPSGHRDA